MTDPQTPATEALRRYFWRCLDDPDAVPEDSELP